MKMAEMTVPKPDPGALADMDAEEAYFAGYNAGFDCAMTAARRVAEDIIKQHMKDRDAKLREMDIQLRTMDTELRTMQAEATRLKAIDDAVEAKLNPGARLQ